MKKTNWRDDIQGLRAVAVVAVVLYHARLTSVPGGYVGVDIFFVISGFLITGLLVREISNTGRLDVLGFYIRRMRRLAPALTAMVLVTAVTCFLLYSPVVQVALAKSSGYSSAYLSNIFFSINATDYLAADADRNPFLHTWSLGVEEQFYLVWPFLILALSRVFAAGRRATAAVLAAIGAVSFLACYVVTTAGWSYYSFFLLPFRAWEFILGGCVFLAGGASVSMLGRSAFARAALGVAGLALIAYGVFFLQKTTPFPGLATLFPVCGAALLIWVGQPGPGSGKPWISRLLSAAPCRRIGRISYSWYLWHWPVLVIGFALWPQASTGRVFAWVALSYLLAELSYLCFERGYRGKPHLLRPNLTNLLRSGSVMVLAGCVSLCWWSVSMQVIKLPSQQAYRDAANDIPHIYDSVDATGQSCHVTQTAAQLSKCVTGAVHGKRSVVLLGDSHAAQWAPALYRIAKTKDWKLYYFTKSACPGLPLPAAYNEDLRAPYVQCVAWTDQAYKRIRALRPEMVFFSSRVTRDKYSLQQWSAGLQKMSAALAPQVTQVVVIGDIPGSPRNIPECLSENAWRKRVLDLTHALRSDCSFRFTGGFRRQVMRSWRESGQLSDHLVYLDMVEPVCGHGARCTPIDKNTGLIKFRDSDHLTASFARSIKSEMQRRIEALVTPAAEAANDPLGQLPPRKTSATVSVLP